MGPYHAVLEHNEIGRGRRRKRERGGEGEEGEGRKERKEEKEWGREAFGHLREREDGLIPLRSSVEVRAVMLLMRMRSGSNWGAIACRLMLN